MKKLILLLVVSVLALGVLPAAAGSGDMSGMANYFPADTLAYVSLRTDDAYLDKLDALIGHLGSFFPDVLPPGFSLKTELYNMPIGPDSAGLTVGNSIRPWLGDFIAVGIIMPPTESLENEPQPVIAIAISDRTAAEAFVNQLIAATDLTEDTEVSTVGDFTVWKLDSIYTRQTIAISDHVAYYASGEQAPELPLAFDSALADSDSFKAVSGMMPGENYDIFAYANVPAFVDIMMAASKQYTYGDEQQILEWLQPFMAINGAAGVGFGTLDDLTLVMDAVQLKGDTSGLEDMGITVNYPGGPVGMDIAAYVPADAQLVVLGNGFGPKVMTGFENLRALGDVVQAQGLLGKLAEQDYDMQEYAWMLDKFNLGDLVTFGDFAFAGMTGLNLEKDVLAWMDGDFASYLRVLPSQAAFPVTVDLVSVAATSDSEATQNVVDHLANAFDQYRIPYTREGSGPRDILALTDAIDRILPPDVPQMILESPDLDLLIGTNGDVAVTGTRPGATFSLNPDGPGLVGDATFVKAQAYFLPDAEMVFYMNLQPLLPVIQSLGQQFGGGSDAPMLVSALRVLDSASATGITNADADIARAVLTLGSPAQ